ncbi:MAG: DUF445 family protein [Gemmatimonadota bacterium]
MAVSPELLQTLLPILFGALAGGLTNTLAIWMLFHPHRPPRLGSRELTFLQGAVPKNQERLARAIGKTVGDRLLTQDDLTRTLGNPEFQAAFQQRLDDILSKLLETERGPVTQLLTPSREAEIRSLAHGAADLAVQRLDGWLDSPEFLRFMERRVTGLMDVVASLPVAHLLTPERGLAMREGAERWLSDVVEGEALERSVDEALKQLAGRLLEPDRTFQEVLPQGMVGALEKAIQAYLPLAIGRLSSLLEDPQTRERFQRTVHEMLQRFLRDLRFHQRVVARLVMNEETVDRVLATVEAEGAEHLAELLQDPAVQSAMARGVNQAIVDFMGRPVSSVLGPSDDISVVEAQETVSRWVVALLREPGTRAFLLEKLSSALERTGEKQWGELLSGIPPEQAAQWLVQIARSAEARRAYGEGIHRLADMAMERPLGRPSRWLPSGSRERLREALEEPIWTWIQGQVPELARRLDVARRVEEKVKHFPVEKMEELVRRVTERELRLIVRLGYVLGASIGLILVGVNRLLG